MAQAMKNSQTLFNSNINTNSVKIVDKSFLEKKFFSQEYYERSEGIVQKFKLNTEQERAFKIVANHAISPYAPQLRMYLGGMGGTGKTQVIKALISFFTLLGRQHEFSLMAPTGTAAALIGGSTYHYALGINEQSGKITVKQKSQVKSRLLGVKYIFLDEVSMLSCRDMCKISERLADVLQNAEDPFGGINIVFAGDFAQLPPAIGNGGQSLYTHKLALVATTLPEQIKIAGKALWHQVTTVVILRQNMRQKTQIPEDAKFRTALTNMRYKACTREDIARSRHFVAWRLGQVSKQFAEQAHDDIRNLNPLLALGVGEAIVFDRLVFT